MRVYWLASAALLLAPSATLLKGGVVYDSIPGPLPGNVTSVGYQATSTREFGNAVTLGPGGRGLQTFTVLMSVWALQSSYPEMSSAGFEVPLTLSLYEQGTSGAVGSKFAEMTIDALLPWRPEASTGCGTAWRAPNGTCYNGMAVPVDFDFSGQNIVLPDALIFGLAFNTQTYGANPTGQPGPYNSLNLGVSGAPTVGADTYPGTLYMSSTWPAMYGDGGPVGVFRGASTWNGFTVNARIEAVPEPSAGWLAFSALVLLAAWRTRQRLERQ